ncbi:MAG TPA: hypothetical protein VHT91_13155, partial [Kofleriaceae bacterium]|nr:hypothetical protein [Kofleriaceae bacterium]
AQLQHLPNVQGVGLGGKERGGQPTGETSIVVVVRKKLPADQLSPAEVIPSEIEGLPTDVIEIAGEFRDIQSSLSHVPGVQAGGSYVEDSTAYKPVRAGTKIEPDTKRGFGTLGFLARITGGTDARIMAVTCAHVCFPPANRGDPVVVTGNPVMGQVSPDGGCSKCCSEVIGTTFKGYYEPSTATFGGMDAAIIPLDPSTQWLAIIEGIGPVRGKYDITSADASPHTYQVRKRGFRTGLTGGVVWMINYHGTSGVTGHRRAYTNGILIKPNSNSLYQFPAFADHGDSGSAVVNEHNEIVGLLFSAVTLDPDNPGAPPPPQLGWGIAMPIADVIARFQQGDHITLEPATSTSLSDVQTTPAASAAPDRPAGLRPSPLTRRVEHDLARSDRGRALTALWQRHSGEINRLINTDRRVAVGWHRNGGPALFQCLVRAADGDSLTLPHEIAGRPVDDCVSAIAALLARHGSAELQRDLDAWRRMLPPLSGQSYDQLLAAVERDQPGP